MSPARLSTRLLPRTVYSELELEEPGWAFLLLLMPPRAWLAASWMQVIQLKAADALQMLAKRRGKWRVCDALCFLYHSSAGRPMQHARTPTPQIVWPFAILSLHALLYALPFVAASPRPLPLPQSRRPLPSRISCQLFNPLTFFLCRQFQLSVTRSRFLQLMLIRRLSSLPVLLLPIGNPPEVQDSSQTCRTTLPTLQLRVLNPRGQCGFDELL